MITIEKTDYQDLRDFCILNCFDNLAINAQSAREMLCKEKSLDDSDFAIIRNGDVWAISLILYKENGYTTISSNVIAFDETEIYGEFEVIKSFCFLA